MNIFSLVYKINWLFIFLLILVSSLGVGLLYSIAGGEWNPWALNQIIRILIGVLLVLLQPSLESMLLSKVLVLILRLELLISLFQQ